MMFMVVALENMRRGIRSCFERALQPRLPMSHRPGLTGLSADVWNDVATDPVTCTCVTHAGGRQVRVADKFAYRPPELGRSCRLACSLMIRCDPE